MGWYNKLVGQTYHLQYPDDTLAYIVISTPSMFDKAFKPFVRRTKCNEDPVDKCVAYHFSTTREVGTISKLK